MRYSFFILYQNSRLISCKTWNCISKFFILLKLKFMSISCTLAGFFPQHDFVVSFTGHLKISINWAMQIFKTLIHSTVQHWKTICVVIITYCSRKKKSFKYRESVMVMVFQHFSFHSKAWLLFLTTCTACCFPWSTNKTH